MVGGGSGEVQRLLAHGQPEGDNQPDDPDFCLSIMSNTFLVGVSIPSRQIDYRSDSNVKSRGIDLAYYSSEANCIQCGRST